MNVENPENVKCLKCRCYRSEASFYNDKGRRLKTCQTCRDRDRIIRERRKCEHNRRKSLCIDCDGSEICEHNKRKSRCIECDGSEICEHGRYRTHCRDCDGSSICEHGRLRNQCKICSDPLKVTIKTMISSAKEKDKKYNRYDVVNFVDYCFIENLLEDYAHCYYEDCKKELQITEHNDSLATIERINNNLGHIKSNCVICCLSCNIARKSRYTTE